MYQSDWRETAAVPDVAARIWEYDLRTSPPTRIPPVTLKTPIARSSVDLAGHAAVRAWQEAADGAPPATVELWREGSLHNAVIHRLTFGDARGPAVFAKHARLAILTVERTIYEEILPHLPLSAPRYFGFRAAGDGFMWLFVEDVGDQCLSPGNPEHRALAGHWLGMLHRSAAGLAAAASLPDGGPGRYLAHLRAGGGKIRAKLGNRALTAEDRAVLKQVLELQDALESRWHALERACEGLPTTLVHGDFEPKNVRVRSVDAGPVLYPIDWETAGWGVPAADLAAPQSPRHASRLDTDVYQTVVRERWPDLDAGSIRKLSILGLLFRALAAIEWESERLRFEDANCLVKPILSMQCYTTWVARALAEAAEWLG